MQQRAPELLAEAGLMCRCPKSLDMELLDQCRLALEITRSVPGLRADAMRLCKVFKVCFSRQADSTQKCGGAASVNPRMV